MAAALNINDIQTVSPVDALWSLIQSQSKAVRHALAKKLEASIQAEKEPKAKMTEEEFYAKIDASIASAKQGRVYTMGEKETGEEFVNRLLSEQ